MILMAVVFAEKVAQAAYNYLGVPYTQMDCQAFIEKCLADSGLKINLPGSNAWYRECKKNGWVGTPEDCKRKFGTIPKGAFLFILENDGGEEKRGYHDGLGNASHIGVYTGTRQGAVHSSSTRKCVAESVFTGKTIRNGGWNRVGLWKRLSYGDSADKILHGGDDNVGILGALFGVGTSQQSQQATTQTDLGTVPAATPAPQSPIGGYQRVVTAQSGNTVNVRETPNGPKKTALPIGTVVTALEGKTDSHGVEWTKVRYEAEGWMMAKFLRG